MWKSKWMSSWMEGDERLQDWLPGAGMAKRKPPTTSTMASGPCLDELRLANLASIDSAEKTWERQGRIGHNELSPSYSNSVVCKMRRFWGKAWTCLLMSVHAVFVLFDSVSTYCLHLHLCDLSICLSACLFIHLSIYLSIYLNLGIYIIWTNVLYV